MIGRVIVLHLSMLLLGSLAWAAEDDAGGVRLRIVPTEVTIVAGEPLLLSLVISNQTDRTVVMSQTTIRNRVQFWTQDAGTNWSWLADGNTYAANEPLSFGVDRRISLAPGHSYAWDELLFVHLHPASKRSLLIFDRSAKYAIKAVLPTDTVESNTIQVSVRPRSARDQSALAALRSSG